MPSRSDDMAHAVIPRDTQLFLVCALLARRGHPRRHCNEEGFGTLSRQLGNVEGYRSSCAGVSGRRPVIMVARMQPQQRWRGPERRETAWAGATPAKTSTHGRAPHAF